MKMTNDKDWMRLMAELEDGCCVSVGGLPMSLGMLGPPSNTNERDRGAAFDTRRVALARFIELSRRKMHLSVEAFASRAQIDPAEVIQLEDSDASAPEPRVVFAVSCFLGADTQKLMELAGHVIPRDDKLREEAVRFAAWSQPSQPLSEDEERVLGEFARAVVARS